MKKLIMLIVFGGDNGDESDWEDPDDTLISTGTNEPIYPN